MTSRLFRRHAGGRQACAFYTQWQSLKLASPSLSHGGVISADIIVAAAASREMPTGHAAMTTLERRHKAAPPAMRNSTINLIRDFCRAFTKCDAVSKPTVAPGSRRSTSWRAHRSDYALIAVGPHFTTKYRRHQPRLMYQNLGGASQCWLARRGPLPLSSFLLGDARWQQALMYFD